jgi:thiol-disulfide isomerase/thioredoxin
MHTASRRRYLAGIAAVGLAGCLGGRDGSASGDGTGGEDSGATTPAAGWYEAELTDVRTDESFTIASLAEKPVLVENFAVWCSNCQRQQETLVEYKKAVGDSVEVVAINVDPNEDAAKVRSHVNEHGFDWRYAVAPPDVTNSFKDQFGQKILVPPQVPKVLVCPGNSVKRLPYGNKGVEELQSLVQC